MDSRRTMVRVVASLSLAIMAVPVIAGAQTQSSTPPVPTFTKDVAPILQRSCQACHRDGSIAPMSLLTYEDARPWAKSMKQRVGLREMPPWFVDRNIGIRSFKEDISLSDADIATIVNWVDGGAPKGNPADMPPPVKFADADTWQLGKPDLIVEMEGEIMVKAAAPDWWGSAKSAGPAVTEDRWMKAVENRPLKGFKVVHHGGVSIDSENEEGSLSNYSVGKNGDVYPDGSGRLLPGGAKLNWGLHLHAIGTETPVKMALGVHFYPKGYVPKYKLRAVSVGGDTEHLLDIPANTDNVRFDTYFGLTKPTVLTAFEPHMHNRGKAMCLTALYPPGSTDVGRTGGRPMAGVQTQTLSCVDRFNFGWLKAYAYTEDSEPILPAGTILQITSWHNNTATNRINYDPTNWIGHGNRTIDDMSHIWVNVYELTEEEYQKRVALRETPGTK